MMRLSDSPSPLLNHAFATQLGSGIYKIGERSAYIYRLGTSVPVYEPDHSEWFLRLRLPVTVGFFNFQIKDVIDIGFPEKLATLSFVPTFEFAVPLKNNWWLEPFAGIGGGRDFSTNTSSYIYAAGLKSLVIFTGKYYDIRLGNRLVYSGYTTADVSFVDDFSIIETGVDFRRLLGNRLDGYDLDWSFFGVNMFYLLSPHLVNINPNPIDIQTEWGFGFTVGTHQALRLFGIRMPRIGLSYRFSTKTDAIRFIIGNPFPIDSPRDVGLEIH